MTDARESRKTVPSAQAKIPWANAVLWGKESEYVVDALSSTWISGGPYVERLEREIGRFSGTRQALAVCNGTAALHVAYLGLDLKPGDEVVVPGFAFMAAANVAIHMGAMPVFAEVDPRTWLVTAATIEPCLTPRTRAIVCVHTYGNVCEMDEILSLGASRGIIVIEDAAEAFASRYKGRPAGAMAPLGTLSFHATKTIATGEGGMVLVSDDAMADRMRLYRSHGTLRRRYWHEVPGHNFRLTNLQAAVGCAQLEFLDRIVAERKRVHRRYLANLDGAPGLAPQEFRPDVDPVLWAMAVRLDPAAYPQGRDGVAGQLADSGIETRPGFYPPDTMDFYGQPPMPVCDAVAGQVLSLPTFPTLTDEQIDFICGRLRDVRR
jgi:perosamine synthetase